MLTLAMGQAGLALQQTPEHHNISQNQLAVAMGVDRSALWGPG
ncbi:hypothetical protein [Prochlorothrix hollandica]|nr:hypothetical protein [Prochlorothrix hollandica]